MNTGIYRIEIGDYFYWGSTMNYTKREREHHSGLRGGCHSNIKMQNVYDKYKDFEMNLVVFTNENILQIEQEFIDLDYDNHYCMNLAKDVTASFLGRTHTLEARKLMSETRKGRKFTPEHRDNLSKAKQGKNNPMYGKKGKNNARYGKKVSSETRKKMSQAHINHTVYHFVHDDGLEEKCTQYDLRTKYNLDISCLSKVTSGQASHHKGWRIKQ